MDNRLIAGLMMATASFLLAAQASSAEDWTTFMYSNTRSGNDTKETVLSAGNIASIQPVWEQDDTYAVQNHLSVSEDGGFLFGPGPSTDGNAITARKTTDGSVVWSTNVTTGGIDVVSPTIAGTTVYVGARGRFPNNVFGVLFALSKKTGNVKWSALSGYWSQDNEASPLSPALVANGMVYFGDDAGGVTAVNTAGGFAWAASGIDTTINNQFFTAPCGNCTMSGAPTFAHVKSLGKDVIFAGASLEDSTHFYGNMTAYDASSGAILWRTLMGPVHASAAIWQKRIYVNSDDGNLYALDEATGNVLWSVALTNGCCGQGSGAPAVIRGVVYAGDQNNNLYALNARTGAQIWKSTNVISSGDTTPILANGVIYTRGTGGGFEGFDASNGSVLFNAASYGLGCVTLNALPIIANGVIYQSGDGTCGNPPELWAFALPGGRASGASRH